MTAGLALEPSPRAAAWRAINPAFTPFADIPPLVPRSIVDGIADEPDLNGPGAGWAASGAFGAVTRTLSIMPATVPLADRLRLRLRRLARRVPAMRAPLLAIVAVTVSLARLAGWGADLPALDIVVLVAALAFALSALPAIRRDAPAADAVAPPLAPARDREELEDEIWRLRDTIERHRSLWTATGSILVRRGPPGSVHPGDNAVPPELGLSATDILAHFDAEPPGPRMQEREMELTTAIGRRRFLRNDVPGFSEDGNQPIVDIVLRDITDQKQIETELARARDAAEAASAAKSRFLAATSHEIRTPLNGILGLAALLDDTALTAEQRSYLGGIRASGATLLALVSDVLDHARLVAGRDAPEIGPVPLRRVIEEAVELLAPPAHDKGIGLVAAIGDGVPDMVALDARRLRQILANLIGNAIKFTPTGAVVVEARVAVAPEGERLCIEVADTGIGLRADDIERVFEEFEQADQGPGRRHEGTGLGLPISRRLARSLGGDITARARGDAGTVFAVDLPLVVVEPAAAIAARLAGRRFALVGPPTPESAVLAAQITRHGGALTAQRDVSALVAEWRGDPAAAAGPLTAILTDLDEASPATVARLRQLAPSARLIVALAPAARGRLPALHEAGLSGYLVRPIRERSAIDLLASDDGAPRADMAPVPAIAVPPPGAVLRVLLVEDNPVNLLLTRSMLHRQGHHVDTAGDGASAVARLTEALAAAPYDLVLMDLHMPDCDGFAATTAIRAVERDRGRAPTPVWALTADASDEARARAAIVGIDRIVLKPIDVETFSAALAATPPWPPEKTPPVTASEAGSRLPATAPDAPPAPHRASEVDAGGSDRPLARQSVG